MHTKVHKLKIKNLNENMILIKINTSHTIQYEHLHNNKHKHMPYNWPAFIAASWLNSGCTSSYALIRIQY